MRLSQAVRMMKLNESTNGQGDKVRDTWVEGLAGRCAGASRREGRREAEVPSRDWTLGMMSARVEVSVGSGFKTINHRR